MFITALTGVLRPVIVLNRSISVHAVTSHFLESHFNIILLSRSRSSKWYFSLRSPNKNPVLTSLFTIRATCFAHLGFLYLITRMTFGEYRAWGCSMYSLLHSPVTSSLLGPNVFLSIIFSNILGPRSSFSVRKRAFHPHKTTEKITVPYILRFLHRAWWYNYTGCW